MSLDTPRMAWEPGDDLGAIVARYARAMPDRAALVHGSTRVTWAALDERADRVAAALVAGDLRKGDRLAILGENSIEYAEVFFGALRAGACVVPLPTMASTDALARMLVDSGSSALFASGAYREAARAIANTPLSRLGLRVGLDFEDDAFRESGACTAATTGPAPRVAIDADDAFDIIYSSGTTGIPKGIVHTHGARKASY